MVLINGRKYQISKYLQMVNAGLCHTIMIHRRLHFGAQFFSNCVMAITHQLHYTTNERAQVHLSAAQAKQVYNRF